MRRIRERAAGHLASMAARCHAVQAEALAPRRLLIAPREDDCHDEQGLRSQGLARAGGSKSRPLAVSDGMRQKIGEVACRDDAQMLRLRIEELHDHLACHRVFHVFKCNALRQKFDRQQRALQMTLASNAELSEQLTAESRRADTLTTNFARAAQDRAAQELRIEERRARLEVDVEERRRLLGLQQSKSRQVAYLSKQVRNRRRQGALDIAALTQEVRDKEAEVERLRAEHRAASEGLERSARREDAQTAQARARLRRWQEEKMTVREDLSLLRAQVDAGGFTEEEKLELWQGRTEVALQRLRELQEENARLVQSASQAATAR